MRQASIPKTVVEALNELFDANPTATTQLLSCRVSTEPATLPASSGEPEAPGEDPPYPAQYQSLQVTTGSTVGVLEVVNAVLNALAPGKRVAVIQGPDGVEGFTLARERHTTADHGE